MELSTLIGSISGIVIGAITTYIALRKQGLEELRAIIELQRKEIERLKKRVAEVEEENALKAEALEKLARMLDGERVERMKDNHRQQQERADLLTRIECLRKELVEWKIDNMRGG